MSATPRDVIDAARLLHERKLTHGSTGNISIRTDDGIYITPTSSSFGTVEAQDLSLIGPDGRHLDGPKPSKEGFLHVAMLRARPHDHAVVHTHSTHSVAVSCLAQLDPDDAIPPLTAYFVMRVGRVKLLPYHAPGDARLSDFVTAAAADYSALLLRNHGPVVSAPGLGRAVEALEELEETARLLLLLRGAPTAPLTPEQRAAVHLGRRSKGLG